MIITTLKTKQAINQIRDLRVDRYNTVQRVLVRINKKTDEINYSASQSLESVHLVPQVSGGEVMMLSSFVCTVYMGIITEEQQSI